MPEVPENRDPRIYLAAERTFLAWIRTGLALMGFGFISARFGLILREEAALGLTSARPGDFSIPIGITLIAFGVAVNIYAGLRHYRFLGVLDSGSFRSAFGVTFACVLAAVLALIGVILALHLALI